MVIVTGATVSTGSGSNAGTITAAGGAGGGSSGNVGGAGSMGRVRWDAPTGTMPSTTSASIARGPSFLTTSISVGSNSLELVGSPNTGFTSYATNSAGVQSNTSTAMFDTGGSATIHPSLSPGWNHVCVFVAGGAAGSFQAERCIDVAYLP
jgi:hypothetical protein